MKNIELKSLTVITGNSFTGKTTLLNEILEKTNEHTISVNTDTRIEIDVNNVLKQS